MKRDLFYIPALVLSVMFFCGALFAAEKSSAIKGFTFVQITDTHWGFSDPKVNPDYKGTLTKTLEEINALNPVPDFVVFTGDLTHTTDDPKERRKRMSEFRDTVKMLKIKDVRFLPGEHDAGLDNGEAYKEFFGKTYYSFDHNGIHFIAIDNVSDKTSSIGEAQLKWIGVLLGKFSKDSHVIIFTHRPLFDLYPDWDWWTRDGAKAIDLLKSFNVVTVFYGHIHQINKHVDGNITFYSGMGSMYPLPSPGSVPKKAPIAWDASAPYKGLGFRTVEVKPLTGELVITEYPIKAQRAAAGNETTIIKITAKKFEYVPNIIKLKKGVTTVFEFTSLDVQHGFNCPGLGVRTDINPGKTSQVRITPLKVGEYNFHCDVFCGNGHEDMTGKIIVE
jgi:plastocyanin